MSFYERKEEPSEEEEAGVCSSLTWSLLGIEDKQPNAQRQKNKNRNMRMTSVIGEPIWGNVRRINKHGGTNHFRMNQVDSNRRMEKFGMKGGQKKKRNHNMVLD